MSTILDDKTEKIQIKLGGMQCSFCTNTIRQALARMNGVQEVGVSLAHEEALIEYNPSIITSVKIKDTLKSLGFKVRDPNKIRSFEEEEKELQTERDRLFIATFLTLVSLALMTFMWLGLTVPWMPWFMLFLALFTMLIPGGHILRMAFASLRRGILNQHVLLEFAAIGGFVGGLFGFLIQSWPIGDFFAVSVFVTSYHVLSGYVSLLVRTRSSQAIKKLMDLQPATARIIKENGIEEEISVGLINLGDIVRVRSGESIPVDGIVVEGTSTVDQSLVTGESTPAYKQKGDHVIGGSVNQFGTLTVEVSKIGTESFLQQIAQHIQQARALKPGVVILIDRILKYFVKIVLFAAFIAFFLWTVIAWVIIGEFKIERAIFALLAVLVMGYPCALGMATPLAMIRGSGIAAQKGILLRSGEAFQVFKDINKIVFDKTGTLTIGKPQVIHVYTSVNYDEKNLLSKAASVELGSDHPLGKAIVNYVIKRKIELLPVNNFQTSVGSGVQGIINNKTILVGNYRFMKENRVIVENLNDRMKELQNQGQTVIFVSENKNPMGIITIGDRLKKESHEAIELLHKEGFETLIISGDSLSVTRTIAKKLGIKEVLAEILPHEKALKIRELQLRGERVAMVGDGINDAPALMQADVGIAIGAGTDIAIESADIILVTDDLKKILDAYHIGKSSYYKTLQNLILAFGFNAIGIGTAITGILHPIWAMIAMVLSVSTVLVNSFGGKTYIKAYKSKKKQNTEHQEEKILH